MQANIDLFPLEHHFEFDVDPADICSTCTERLICIYTVRQDIRNLNGSTESQICIPSISKGHQRDFWIDKSQQFFFREFFQIFQRFWNLLKWFGRFFFDCRSDFYIFFLFTARRSCDRALGPSGSIGGFRTRAEKGPTKYQRTELQPFCVETRNKSWSYYRWSYWSPQTSLRYLGQHCECSFQDGEYRQSWVHSSRLKTHSSTFLQLETFRGGTRS